MAGSVTSVATGERTSAGAEAPAPAERITVTDELRQPIDGWGAAVVADDPMEPLVEPRMPPTRVKELDRLVFREAGINLIRVFSPGYGNERASGRVGAPVMDDPRFALMRRGAPYGVKFMLTGADAPAWMLTVPAQAALRHARTPGRAVLGKPLARGHEKAYARYLGRILVFAKDRIGRQFDYAAVANEPDNHAALLTMTPQQAAAAYAELARIIRSEHLRTRLVIGDDTTWRATIRYARAELAAPGVRQEAAVIGSHAYGGSRADRLALAALADKNHLSVWETEWTNGCRGCSRTAEAVMARALGWSEQIEEAIDDAAARAWFTLLPAAVKHGASGTLVVRRLRDPLKPFFLTKRFYLLRQYTYAGPAGSRRLAVTVDPPSPSVYAVAFKNGDRVSVVVTNANPTQQRVLLDLGSARSSLERYRTSAEENFRSLPSLSYGGRPLLVTLPKESVTTFTRS